VHINEYFEYLLGNIGSISKEMFVMCHIRGCKLMLKIDLDIIMGYNQMHVIWGIRVEWGIGWLKCK
jgi:hypothetical protein